jgi:hypothetical protein
MLHRARRPATHATSRPVRLPAMIPVRVRPAGKPVDRHVLRHARNPVYHEVQDQSFPFSFFKYSDFPFHTVHRLLLHI